jgi:hypothetical protein
MRESGGCPDKRMDAMPDKSSGMAIIYFDFQMMCHEIMRCLSSMAGLPRKIPFAARVLVAVEPTVKTECDPIVTPGPTQQPAPIQTPSSSFIDRVIRSNVLRL